MLRPTHTHEDYTANLVMVNTHPGVKRKKKTVAEEAVKKKKKKETRGRKVKKGRNIYVFDITLLPSASQKKILNRDQRLFKKMYIFANERLSHPIERQKDGFFYFWDIDAKLHKSRLNVPLKGVLPYSPKQVMMEQTEMISQSTWMRKASYQVTHRATVMAFRDNSPKFKKRNPAFDYENSYEAKVSYRIKNGALYIRKHRTSIPIAETIPHGGLESVVITRNSDGSYTARISILERADKAESLTNDRRGVLETDTKKVKLECSEYLPEQLEVALDKFKNRVYGLITNTISYHSLRHSYMACLSVSKGLYGQKVSKYFDMYNMAALSVYLQLKEDESQRDENYKPKDFFVITEGFRFEGKTLYVSRLDIKVTLEDKLDGKHYDYLVFYKKKNGQWLVSGKKRKKKIFLNLSRIARTFYSAET
jgi:hypothetical protein